MKKIFNIIAMTAAFAVGVFSISSCKKFLDEAPNNGETREYIFEDYLRSQRYLDGIYNNMLHHHIGGDKFGDYHGMLESATDMSEYTADYGATNKAFNVGNWKHTNASYEVSENWYRCYKQIRKCWMFLDNIDNFKNEPEGRKPLMQGEAHFLLAYFYFELYRRYGGVPLVKQVLSLEDDYRIPRSTEAETMKFILDELNIAENLVPDQWTQEDFGRVTKAWCKALRSRATLYAASPLHNPTNDKAKWEEAAAAAKDCLDYCESTGYHKLFPDYQNIFMRYTPDKIPEIIVFKIGGANNYNFNSSIINYEQASPGDDYWGYASNSPSQNLVDRYPVIVFDSDGKAIGTEDFDWNNPNHVANMYENRDPRFYWTVLFNGRMWYKRDIQTWRDGNVYGLDRDPKNQLFSRTGYYLRKFWPRECKDKNMPGSSKIYGFYIRLGEIYMNYAEAMNEAFGPDSNGGNGGMTAIEAVNKLRERLVCPASENIGGSSDTYYFIKVERQENPLFPVLPDGMPGLPTGMSQDVAREKIHNERAIEFAFEDQYFYDILRWKEGDKHIGTTLFGLDIVKSGETFTYNRTAVEDRPFDPNRMYLYPIPQDEVYNLGIEQNPGW